MATISCDVALEEMGRNKTSQTKNLILGHISNAVHFFVFAYVIFILYICLINEWVYFTWHPILLAIGVSFVAATCLRVLGVLVHAININITLIMLCY